MKTTLCTLYNSLYLDKGLVLYDSLKACSADFELYVLCMDDRCFEILSDLGEANLKPIHLQNVENEKMLEAKSNRCFTEYCWTCTSRIIQFILEKFNPPVCTYIDADMFFYSDPQMLIEEMLQDGKSVMMVPHRFLPHQVDALRNVGTYCVEFNSFKNDQKGLEVLNDWHRKCLDCCSILRDGVHWGDQKYMDEWPKIFPDAVHVAQNPGAGIAPWNFSQYYLDQNDEVVYKTTKEKTALVFVHYPGITFFSRKVVNTNVPQENNNDRLIQYLYLPYLKALSNKQTFLWEKYGLHVLIKMHPAADKGIKEIFLKSFLGRWLFYIKMKLSHTHYIYNI